MRLKSSSAKSSKSTGSAQHDATCVTRDTKAKMWTVCNSWLASKQCNKAQLHYLPTILFICWSSFMVRGLWSRVKCCVVCRTACVSWLGLAAQYTASKQTVPKLSFASSQVSQASKTVVYGRFLTSLPPLPTLKQNHSWGDIVVSGASTPPPHPQIWLPHLLETVVPISTTTVAQDVKLTEPKGYITASSTDH